MTPSSLAAAARGAARHASRTARRSSTCPSSSTSTRTPTGRRRRSSPTSRAAVAEAAPTLNRYPDREFTELRDRAGGLPRATASPPEQVWAANGSNEVMLQLLQAFGGPGRTALSFAPTYSMYPEYARDTNTDLGRRAPRDDFTLDLDRAPSAGRGAAAERRAAAVARTTRPAPRCRPRRSATLCEARRRAADRRRRRGVRRVPPGRHAQRARAAARRTATWSSPGP